MFNLLFIFKMKKLYLILLFTILLIPSLVKAQNGCTTCALAEILGEEWKTPNYGSSGGGTFGWTFNVRNRFGRKINAAEIKKLENAANNNSSGVKRVDKQAIVYGNDGFLQYKLVPHIVTLKSGEPYFVYQKYISGFH